MASQKAALAHSTSMVFQPREAWSTKQKLGGVALSVLDDKQLRPSRRRLCAFDYGMCFALPREARRPY